MRWPAALGLSAAAFYALHACARHSLLLLAPPSCSRLELFVLSCPPGTRGHSAARHANAIALVRSSPLPSRLVPCRNETPPAARWRGPSEPEARLADSELHVLRLALASEACGFLVLEDDALVDWAVVRRVVEEMAALREHWDVISVYDPSYYDRGLGRYYYTDRALRFGCLHRILAGKAFTVGMIYSRVGAARVLQAMAGTWTLQYDLMLGQVNGLPLQRLRDFTGVAIDPAVPSTRVPWLRILRWGCEPPAVLHDHFKSTIDHKLPKPRLRTKSAKHKRHPGNHSSRGKYSQ
ncbi:hypothetical protein AB1Y20_013633 [Prymnesium parvum]|uniref:Glycosyltransferase 25 family member n=1 Tax=Prymnesium parvum TaxID=97485 RepID=A0AB34IJH9_PRYPA